MMDYCQITVCQLSLQDKKIIQIARRNFKTQTSHPISHLELQIVYSVTVNCRAPARGWLFGIYGVSFCTTQNLHFSLKTATFEIRLF